MTDYLGPEVEMPNHFGVSKSKQIDSARVLNKLRESLQGLAGVSPDAGAVTALELATDFESIRRLASNTLDSKFSEMQLRMLCSMQEYIDFMHTLAPRVWSDTAMEDHACWRQLKEMAKDALAAFGWSANPPASL